MIVEVNDTDKILRVADGTDVEELINFVAKMGYIRGWTIGIRKSRAKSKPILLSENETDSTVETIPKESLTFTAQENAIEIEAVADVKEIDEVNTTDYSPSAESQELSQLEPQYNAENSIITFRRTK